MNEQEKQRVEELNERLYKTETIRDAALFALFCGVILLIGYFVGPLSK